MTSHVGRLYAAAAGLLAFFVLWAGIAAHPWKTTAADPRLTALAQRQQLLRREAVLVRTVVQQRTAAAKVAAQKAQKARQVAAAAPAPVRVVTLPPLVVTRTS